MRCRALGLRPDGRLLALTSYENRVYQVWLEEGPPVVAKFYRPGRWSDAQIDEEHAFAHELAEREIPVVAPQQLTRRSAASASRSIRAAAGARPSSTIRRRWNGSAASSAASMRSARTKPFAASRVARRRRPSATSRAPSCSTHAFIPADLLDAWKAVTEQALAAGRATASQRAGDVKAIRLHGDCHPGNVLWTEDGPALRRPRRRAHGAGDAGPVDAALGRPRGDVAAARATCSRGYEDFMEFDRRELHLLEALRTLRLIHYSAWIARRWDDPALPGRVPLVQHPALLAGPHPGAARADRADAGRAAGGRLGIVSCCSRSDAHASRPSLLALPWPRAAAPAQDAGALLARHTALQKQLADNPFGRPLHVESTAAGGRHKGEIHAVIDQPYGVVAPALARPAHWCDILTLQVNVKGCKRRRSDRRWPPLSRASRATPWTARTGSISASTPPRRVPTTCRSR